MKRIKGLILILIILNPTIVSAKEILNVQKINEEIYEESNMAINDVEESKTETASSTKEADTSESYLTENSTELLNEPRRIPSPSSVWGTVPWTWDEDTTTIELSGGEAGTPEEAPWKTYPSVTRIIINGTVVFPVDSQSMFSQLSDLVEIQNSENIDVSNVTNMSGMFYRASSLANLDVSNWDVSNVTDMGLMFSGARRLQSLDVSNWDVSNVTNMGQMFEAVEFESLDVSTWDVSNVTHMFSMFTLANSLKYLDVSNWDVSNVRNMMFLFAQTNSLAELDVSNWNVSNVGDMRYIFAFASSLDYLDLSSWDVSNVEIMTGMFQSMSSLKEFKLGEKSIFDSSVMLPLIDESDIYSGRWIQLSDNLGNKPSNPTIYQNSTDFMDSYKGREPGTYVWEKKITPSPVTVKYQDTEGNQLAEPTILSGEIGVWYESEAKEIAGWYVVETPDNASGIFTEEAQEVVYVYERSDAAPVTVKYQDTEGNQLADPTVLSGKVGLPYTSEVKEIAGWYVVETPDNASGTFSDAAQEVVYVYERSDAAPVTVKYQDTEGNQLAEPTILSGEIGVWYESEAKEIAGWYVVETPSNASGSFSGEAQEVVYVYERSDAASVTVRYQDSDGNQLSDPTVLSGKIGLPYTSEAKEIAGWYVAETPDNASGTFSDVAQEVVYVYERSDAAPVTVKYQDSEGNQLAEPHVLTGKVGLPYESEAKEIAGWYVVEIPDNASGTFSDAAQEVVYVYERSDAAPVTVKYQDTVGNQLADPTVLGGKVGLPYESKAKEIPGWYVVETPSNASGTFSEEAQEVVYVYERSDAAPVTVKYQDTVGNQLAEPTILSGKVGLPYESKAKEIPGWYVVETPSNASGTFSEEAQEVVYVYDRSDAAPVTVRYEDTEGNQLSEPTVLSGKVGLSYESEAKEIPGWYVVETPENALGIFAEDPQEVVYVYTEKTSGDDQDNTNNSTPDDKGKNTPNKNLPNTGESMFGQLLMIVLGSFIILGSLFMNYKSRRNKTN